MSHLGDTLGNVKNLTKTATATAALLLAITLSACGDDSASESGESAGVQSRSRSVESETPETTQTESPEEPSDDSPTDPEADAKFLEYVRDNLLPQTQIPDATDEELISAGHEACDQLDAGTALEDVRVVDGEQAHENGAFYDTSAIMNGAIVAYCPQYL